MTTPKRFPWFRALLGLLGAVFISAFIFRLVPWHGGKASLEIRLKDHREAIGDFATLNVTLRAIRLRHRPPTPGAPVEWSELIPALKIIDLTRLTDGRSTTVFTGDLPAESYDALHLEFIRVQGKLGNGEGDVSIKNSTAPIRLPFSLYPGKDTRIVIDLVVLDTTDEGGGYELHVGGYEHYMNGKLVAKIPPA